MVSCRAYKFSMESFISYGKLLARNASDFLFGEFGTTTFYGELRRKDAAGQVEAYSHFGVSENRVVLLRMPGVLRQGFTKPLTADVLRFQQLFPEYAKHELVVVVAYEEYDDVNLLNEALGQGYFLATVSESVFTSAVPPGFEGRDFNAVPGEE